MLCLLALTDSSDQFLWQVKSHMDTHLNLKPHLCPECGQRSNWKWDICKHMQAKHPASRKEELTLSQEEAQATIHQYLATRLHQAQLLLHLCRLVRFYALTKDGWYISLPWS